MPPSPWPITRYQRLSRLFGLLAVAVSGGALIGWFIGSTTLKGVRAGYIPMAPNTALLFVLLGGVLVWFNGKSARKNMVARSVIAFAVVVALTRLSEYATGFEFGVDQWLFRFPAESIGLSPVGKMAFPTAMTFLVTGVSFFLVTLTNHRWANDLAKVNAVIAGSIGLAFSLGYFYGAPLLYGGHAIAMALNTAVCFTLLAVGIFIRASTRDIAERRRAKEALQRAHDELERRILERTAELAAANDDLQREVAERKLAEAALRKSEQRYRPLFKNNPMPMWVYDTETLQFVAVNDAAVNHYGYSHEEFLELSIEDIHPQEDLADLLNNIPVNGGRVHWDRTWRHRTKDGTIIDVEITSDTLDFGGKPARVVLAADISVRKRAEEARRQSERRYESLVNSIDGIVWEADPQTFAFTFVSRQAKRLLGYPISQWLEEPSFWADHIHPDDREWAVEFCLNATAKGTDHQFEYRMIAADGRVVWLKDHVTISIVDGGSVRLRGVMLDITERKVAEEALKETKEWLTSVYESSRDGIIVEKDERIVFVNRSYANLFGYEPDELIGQSVCLVSEQEPSERMLEYSRRRMRGEEAPSFYEFKGTRKDGTEVSLEASVSTAKIGDSTYIIALCRDVTERKRAEAEIQLHQVRFQQLFDNAPMGIVMADRNDHPLGANKEFEAIFQFSLSELQEQSLNESIVPDALLAEGSELSSRTLDREVVRKETMRKRKDGSLVPVQIYGVPIVTDDETTGIFGIYIDLSERKRMEDERHIISEIIQGAITTSDLDEFLSLVHQAIGKCLYAENCFVALYDDVTELMHFPFWVDKLDPCPPPRPVGLGFSSYVLRTGTPMLVDPELTEEMYQRGEVQKSGSASASWLGVPLRTPTRTIGVLVVQHYEEENAYDERDLEFLTSVGNQIALAIERKHAENQHRKDARRIKIAATKLERQRAFLRQIIDLNPSFIFAKDKKGRFTLVNKALAGAYGTTVERLLGKTDADFNANQEEVELFRRADLEVIASGKEKFIPEEAFTDAAGNTRWVQTMKRPIISPNGTAKQILGVATDITERKKSEEALRESEAMLRQAQKMESIGTLAGGIAHDFNNLMTAVNGYSQLVLRKLSVDDPLRPKIEEIKKAGERATALTRQLLAFSRKQMLHPEVINLNTVITGLGRMLPRLIGEDIELRFELAPSLHQVKADPGQMEQILMNLAVNARDAIPAGGWITIKTETVDLLGKSVKQRLVIEPGKYVLLSVSDNGCGMDAETQAHIFEPFFTTKEPGKGTGLGLSTVYGIVKQSGGSIWVYSEPGQGTSFKIYLPVCDDLMETDQPGDDSRCTLRGHETILLVEDEDMVRDLCKEVLGTYGYEVVLASNGKDGLSACQKFAGRIDLLITDVVMPHMSGRELAEQVSALRPDVRVLYMSGFTDDAVVRHGVLDAGVCFIQKPFSPEGLALKAREVLDQNLDQNRRH